MELTNIHHKRTVFHKGNHYDDGNDDEQVFLFVAVDIVRVVNPPPPPPLRQDADFLHPVRFRFQIITRVKRIYGFSEACRPPTIMT